VVLPSEEARGEYAVPTSEALQCKSTVSACVQNGKAMLEAMAREQLNGTLHHSAACRLVADTFLAVVADLGQAAESDEMAVVAPRIERVNSRFFHISDLIARNNMVTVPQVTAEAPASAATSGADAGRGTAHHAANDRSDASVAGKRPKRHSFNGLPSTFGSGSSAAPPKVAHPVIDEALALQQFGGDSTFLRQMSLKFISSGKGVTERITALVDSLASRGDGPTPSSLYTDLRRESHSLKGAASTIGAMRLSQCALDLQLACESEATHAKLAELSAQVIAQFQNVCQAIEPPERSAAAEQEPARHDRGDPRGGGGAGGGFKARRDRDAAGGAKARESLDGVGQSMAADKTNAQQSRLPVRRPARGRGAN